MNGGSSIDDSFRSDTTPLSGEEQRLGKNTLVIDADPRAGQEIAAALGGHGFSVTLMHSGGDALAVLAHSPHDLILVDPSLPDIPFVNFIQEVNRLGSIPRIPVIVLSGKASEDDEIVHLEIGADDYIAKPVPCKKLLARIHLILRRQKEWQIGTSPSDSEIIIDRITILNGQYTALCGDETVGFSKMEFALLVHMAINRGKVLTRQALYRLIGNHRTELVGRKIDMMISRIRRKLKGYSHYIETVAGVGYRFH